METPRRPNGSSSEAQFAQQVHDRLYGGSLANVNSPGFRVSRTTRGNKIQTRTVPRGTAGIHWASQGKRYDSTKLYTINEMVIVGPNNPAITVPPAAIKARPGQYVCVQEPTTHPTTGVIQYPVWPPPGLTETQALDDPENPLIFWLPFYVVCSNV